MGQRWANAIVRIITNDISTAAIKMKMTPNELNTDVTTAIATNVTPNELNLLL